MGQKIAITHIKADFDAMASAWAAYRLYGCDSIWVCTESETNVYSYLQTLGSPPVYHAKPKDIEKATDIDHLIITDCKQKKRIGALAALIPKAKKITVVDHHPSYAKDIDADEEIITQYGSCVTVLVHMLSKAGKTITPEDATLFMLGIYEDTGMLTFSSTTVDDVLAVANLLDAGGDTTVVSDYVKREFSREQVFILNELLMNMTTVNIDGVNVTYSFASIDVYTEELAFLAMRMMDMEGLDSLFILVRSGPRVTIIGRSKNPQVNAGKIISRFGGGGHATAASANIKELELHEAVDLLVVTLREEIKPVRTVNEIMSTPARAIEMSDTIDEAWNVTLKYNLNHIPVVSGEKTVGILSRKDILQGVKHKLIQEPVSLLMQTEIDVVAPDTPFRLAEDILISSNQKLLPVEQDGKLVGVLTRTDLLRLMHEESANRSAYEEGAKARLGLSRVRSVRDIMKNDLPAEYYTCLEEIGKISSDNNFSAYVVGGFVRDLIMGHSNSDMDIVVEGDALIIAHEYAKLKSAKLTVHDKYKTASVTLPSGEKVDFATSRTEFYSMPGAVPAVEYSSLRNDLTRRDFTINAMAIRIDTEDFGQLIDYFGGQRDILDKKIRVLHSLSFVDDPTRAFRAVRFAARYGFKLGSHTERLLKHADELGLFSKIRGGKLFIEVKYILNEDKYLRALEEFRKYGMLKYIAPTLGINKNRTDQFIYLDSLYGRFKDKLSKDTHIAYIRYALLMFDFPTKEYKQVLKDQSAEETLAERLSQIQSKAKYTAKKIKGMKTPHPSEIYTVLNKLTDEELMLVAVILGENLNYLVISYIEKDRHTKTFLNGNNLIRMGVPESEILGDILKELLYARLDGKITTREQEEEYVRSRMQ